MPQIFSESKRTQLTEIERLLIEEKGDEHAGSATNIPLRENAFALSDKEKILHISQKFKEIMEILGLDLSDDSLAGTPHRVAKMYVSEIFSGINPINKPVIRLFNNQYNYSEMLIEKNISFHSTCEHHFVPIYGKVHVAYFPADKVIGLSKINRIVRYVAQRPQVQERLTIQIAEELQLGMNNQDIAVIVEADHMCVHARGVKDESSNTISAYYGGKFNNEAVKQELLKHIYHGV